MISGSWARERRFTIPRLLPRRLRSLHTVALVLGVVVFGWLAWTWYRSSSFVKVQRVTVTGLSGPDVPQIRSALSTAALQMTTLNMNIGRLEAAVSRYPWVQRLTVTTSGSHSVEIHVAEQVPVALVEFGGRLEVVDADGSLLPAGTTHGALPTVPLGSTPLTRRITAPGARAAIAALAAAPYALLAHISNATTTSAHGVVVQLRNGPQLYFGAPTQFASKWTAAVAVLQNRYSVGASYIDITDPQRPAPGTAVSATQAANLGLPSPGSSSSSGGGTGTGTGANGNTGNPTSTTG